MRSLYLSSKILGSSHYTLWKRSRLWPSGCPLSLCTFSQLSAIFTVYTKSSERSPLPYLKLQSFHCLPFFILPHGAQYLLIRYTTLFCDFVCASPADRALAEWGMQSKAPGWVTGTLLGLGLRCCLPGSAVGKAGVRNQRQDTNLALQRGCRS